MKIKRGANPRGPTAGSATVVLMRVCVVAW